MQLSTVSIVSQHPGPEKKTDKPNAVPSAFNIPQEKQTEAPQKTNTATHTTQPKQADLSQSDALNKPLRKKPVSPANTANTATKVSNNRKDTAKPMSIPIPGTSTRAPDTQQVHNRSGTPSPINTEQLSKSQARPLPKTQRTPESPQTAQPMPLPSEKTFSSALDSHSDTKSNQASPRQANTNTTASKNAGVNRTNSETSRAPTCHGVKPVYPNTSRLRGEAGQVLLAILVKAGGDIQEVQLQQSSGFARLDRAALKAVRQWRCQAALEPGWIIQSVRFGLVD